MQRSALIIGAYGQDGFYLRNYLKTLEYRVISAGRDLVSAGEKQTAFDVLDVDAVASLIAAERPNEIYYLAAYHHSSQENTETLSQLFDYSYKVHCVGLLNVLEAVANMGQQSRVFYAASSLIFGNPRRAPQNEDTLFAPVCAYGVTKAAGIGIGRLYRQERNVFFSTGILYNHESPRRADKFVTRKIVQAVVDIHRGKRSSVELGRLDVQVDWTYAGDVVRAMHAILQMDAPGEFVVASGELHTVRQFAERAFSALSMNYREYVTETPSVLQRANRQVPFQGDASRLRAVTGWKPEVSFDNLVDMMVRLEMDVLHAE